MSSSATLLAASTADTPQNNGTLSDYSSFAQFSAVLTVIMCIASFVGAILFFLLMFSHKYRTKSYSMYFLFLALSDYFTILLLSLIDIDEWLIAIRRSDGFFLHHIESCVFVEHAYTISSMCSSWFLVGAIIDRFISYVYPHKRSTFCTRTRATIVCLVITFISTAVTLITVLANIESVVALYEADQQFCLVETTHFVHGYFIFLSLGLTLLAPVATVIVLSALILKKIHREGLDSDETPSIENGQADHVKRSSLALAVLAVTSGLLLAPVTLAEVVETIMKLSRDNFTGFEGAASTMWSIFHLIRVVNFCCKFYVLIGYSRMYRQDLGQIFGFGPYPEKLKDDNSDAENDNDPEDNV